jgi:hypothetical protein
MHAALQVQRLGLAGSTGCKRLQKEQRCVRFAGLQGRIGIGQ